MPIKIAKSSRHSKITGDFGEALVAYWLSKYGFECGRFDHTGIDIVAVRPQDGQVLGISVKSRSRTEGTETAALVIRRKDLHKAQEACASFGWVPYFAIVVDAGPVLWCFVLSLAHLETMFSAHLSTINWKMSSDHLARYHEDAEIMILKMSTSPEGWWESRSNATSQSWP
jgi:Holliday junction resolvase-like predicted endonuclease